MLDYAASNNINIILFEEPSRIARDLLIQEVIYNLCTDLGFKLIAVHCPDAFEDGVVSTLVRQVVGAVAEFQKSEVVARLKHAREEKAKTTTARTLRGKPKVTGKKSTLETKKGTTIKTILNKWVKKSKIQAGDIADAQRALSTRRVRTKHGKEVSIAQVTSWIASLRGKI